jgi:2-octaprenyl-6-methoxyphenol hydroxylase
MTIVENARLRSVLLAAVLAAPGVRLAQVTRLISAAPARSRIIATTAIGTTIKAALLISAEGRGSALREAAGIKGTRWHHGQTGIVTAVRLERDHGGRALQHFLPGGPFALLPLPAQRACVTWSEADAVAAPLLTAGDTAFKMALEDRLGGQFGRVALDGPRRSWPLETYLARSLIADRFALIGDSARSVHPIAGQGLNLGFRDVAALVQAMVDAARTGQDIGAAPVLEAYQQRRRLDGVMSATAFDGLNRLFSSDVAVLRTARDAGLGLVERLPMLKRWFVAEASGETGDVPRLLQGVMP